MSQGMPQFEPSLFLPQIAWFLASFFLLWGALQFWIVPQYRRLLDRRAKALDALLKTIHQLQQEIETIQQRNTYFLSAAKINSARSLEKAKEAGERTQAEATLQARKIYEAHMAQFQEKLALKTKNSLNETAALIPTISQWLTEYHNGSLRQKPFRP